LNILITICARGGSKGIPGKNIILLNGIPLIVYSIEIAKLFANIYKADIALSTDNEEITQIAFQNEITTNYKRPYNLATDDAGKLDCIIDVLNFEEKSRKKIYDYVLDLDVTSPLRNLNDLESAFSILQNDINALNIFSVNNANRNPYFNMVEKKENGYYGLVKTGVFLTRQTSPLVYDLNASFYFYKRDFFLSKQFTAINNYSLIYLMPHICFDLDHLIDFDFMEYLLVNNKLGFTL
jgi:CMP-N,N'-diacetyllegionaminic acid synthase